MIEPPAEPPRFRAADRAEPMNILLTKPDALGDQLIVAGLVQTLLRLRADIRLVWHVRTGSEAFAPLVGAEVFTPDTAQPPATEAARLAAERREADFIHIEKLSQLALSTLGPGWIINGSLERRYHGNLNIRREPLDAARLISDMRNIAFSLGSACASGSGRPSHVLRAIGLSDRQARSSIRLGFGRYTGEEELVSACRRINDAAHAQQVLPA